MESSMFYWKKASDYTSYDTEAYHVKLGTLLYGSINEAYLFPRIPGWSSILSAEEPLNQAQTHVLGLQEGTDQPQIILNDEGQNKVPWQQKLLKEIKKSLNKTRRQQKQMRSKLGPIIIHINGKPLRSPTKSDSPRHSESDSDELQPSSICKAQCAVDDSLCYKEFLCGSDSSEDEPSESVGNLSVSEASQPEAAEPCKETGETKEYPEYKIFNSQLGGVRYHFLMELQIRKMRRIYEQEMKESENKEKTNDLIIEVQNPEADEKCEESTKYEDDPIAKYSPKLYQCQNEIEQTRHIESIIQTMADALDNDQENMANYSLNLSDSVTENYENECFFPNEEESFLLESEHDTNISELMKVSFTEKMFNGNSFVHEESNSTSETPACPIQSPALFSDQTETPLLEELAMKLALLRSCPSPAIVPDRLKYHENAPATGDVERPYDQDMAYLETNDLDLLAQALALLKSNDEGTEFQEVDRPDAVQLPSTVDFNGPLDQAIVTLKPIDQATDVGSSVVKPTAVERRADCTNGIQRPIEQVFPLHGPVQQQTTVVGRADQAYAVRGPVQQQTTVVERADKAYAFREPVDRAIAICGPVDHTVRESSPVVRFPFNQTIRETVDNSSAFRGFVNQTIRQSHNQANPFCVPFNQTNRDFDQNSPAIHRHVDQTGAFRGPANTANRYHGNVRQSNAIRHPVDQRIHYGNPINELPFAHRGPLNRAGGFPGPFAYAAAFNQPYDPAIAFQGPLFQPFTFEGFLGRTAASQGLLNQATICQGPFQQPSIYEPSGHHIGVHSPFPY